MIAPNIAANAASMVVAILSQLGLSVAAYRLMGAEQYALIGAFSTIMTVAAVFDNGLGLALIRETARRRQFPPSSHEGVRQLVFNFGALYIAIAGLIFLVIAAAAPFMATHWFRPGASSAGEVTLALILMGAAIAIQRLRGLFQATLDGLERQVPSGLLLIVSGLVRLALGVGALVFVSPSALAFFASQVLASIFETASFAVVAQKLMPRTSAPVRLDRRIMSQGAKFAATTASVAATGTAIQVADSVIVAAMLPLAVFGNYALVSQMCSVLGRLTTPVLNAAYPRIAALVRDERIPELKRMVFMVSALSNLLLAAGAFALIFFGGPMIELVSGSREVGRDFAIVLALLTGAYAFNSLPRPMHVVQMAEGFPSIALRINIGMAAFYLPAIILLTPRYGVVAPAACLLAGYFGGFLAFLATTFRHRLRGERRRWLLKACLSPVLAAGAMFALGRLAATGAGVEGAIPLTAIAVCVAGLALLAGVAANGDLMLAVSGGLKRLRFR